MLSLELLQVLLGRGRECYVPCLSMYVSRHHLKLIPKDDSIYVKDLGVSVEHFKNIMIF